MLTNLTLILAEEGANQQAPSGLSFLFPMLAVGLIFYFLMLRPQSKERKQREAMINAVKKNDRIVTIGGIVGTVTSVRDDEVTLKVDESSNTKITFTRSSIQRVVAPTQRENGGKE